MEGGGATLYVKNKNVLVEWKSSVDTVGIKCADLKNEFLLWIFTAFPVTQNGTK